MFIGLRIPDFLPAQSVAFAVLLGLASLQHSASASDAVAYTAEKTIVYDQTDSGQPIIQTKNAFVFEATIREAASNLVNNAVIQSPQSVSTALLPDGDKLTFKQKNTKQSTLESSYGSGVYHFIFNTVHDGQKNLALTLQGDTYPNAPHVANFSALQNADAGAFLTVTWDPFAAGTTADYIQLRIEDTQGNKLFESPDIGLPGALDGKATSVIIPRHSFLPGQTNDVSLTFSKIVALDSISYPGATGRAIYSRKTKISATASASVAAADVKQFELYKSKRLHQSDSGQPLLDSTKVYRLEASVTSSSAGTVSAVTFSTPAAKTVTVPQSDGKHFDFADSFAAPDLLDENYPPGNYPFKISTTHDGLKQPVLPLPQLAFPNAPHILNFDAAQSLNPTADFILLWDPFTGGTSADYIRLRIEDALGNKVYESGNFGDPAGLKGTATTAVIPSGTLFPGKSYSATLQFQKNSTVDTQTYPGALGASGYFSRTQFPIHTSGGAIVDRPVFRSFALLSSGGFQIQGDANPANHYAIQVSADLRSWQTLATIDAPNGHFQFVDSSPLAARRLYRLLVQ